MSTLTDFYPKFNGNYIIGVQWLEDANYADFGLRTNNRLERGYDTIPVDFTIDDIKHMVLTDSGTSARTRFVVDKSVIANVICQDVPISSLSGNGSLVTCTFGSPMNTFATTNDVLLGMFGGLPEGADWTGEFGSGWFYSDFDTFDVNGFTYTSTATFTPLTGADGAYIPIRVIEFTDTMTNLLGELSGGELHIYRNI